MNLTSNTTLTIIATLIALAGAYWYFFTGSTSEEPPLSSTSVPENPAQMQFRALVSKLQPISFATGIFRDQRFTVLVDLATPISPEPVGRPDPFALAGSVSGK